ncbi:unnamed protein product [Peronospora belbahrii]|uniref:WRKY19-like zinc finger domain-containing protein n=1 Tax=Peronospora belbahrii TaxID=622444 RepID=A0ABN8CX50_9STRA|nr:unnamed protein product [Peronospora belbahrii]
MDPSEERENDYLHFLHGMRPDDTNIQTSMPDLSTTQSSELDFRTSFVGPDGLPEIDHDGAEFARMLLAQTEQEQKETEVEDTVTMETGVLQLSSPDTITKVVRDVSALQQAWTGVALFISLVSSANTPSAISLIKELGIALSTVVVKSANRKDARNRSRDTDFAQDTAESLCAPLKVVRTRGWKEDIAKHMAVADFVNTKAARDEISVAADVFRMVAAHGGGKKCEADGCKNWALGGGICLEHKGPGKRCKTLGCTKYDLGGGHCIAHGGGRKCVVEGCDKIRQVNKRCRGHGGKVMCSVLNCDRAAQNRKLCKAHGGGKLCQHEGCTNKQKGKGLCIRHGGGTKCKESNCSAIDRGGGYCKGHGGGKKCSFAYCNKWVIGGGYCPDHLDLEFPHPSEEISRITTNSYLTSESVATI